MLRKYLSAFLVMVILVQAGGQIVLAQDKSIRKIEQLKEKLSHFGTGDKAQVEVTLTNNSKVKGYISQVNVNSFVIVVDRSGATNEIQFSEVNKLKGYNMSTGTKIAIGFGIAAVALALLVLIGLHFAD